MKQASAFPPNFIHSLDATHMMLTALECRVRSLFLTREAGGVLTVIPLSIDPGFDIRLCA